MPNPVAVTACALLIEAAFGYPAWLFQAVRHPVVWLGRLIATLDRRLPRSRPAGALALAAVLLAAALPGMVLTALLPLLPLAVLASTCLAQRSLAQHVSAVASGLRLGLPEGRAAVAHIVGRDPHQLDAAAVARAAIESLAENFSDGVVAPAFWGCVAGLPGMAVFKAVNTADSMIGHRTPRHERFGWAAARLDDLVNLPASRLAATWIVLAAALLPGGRAGEALRAVWRDAGRHRSPNAGWPEAAMAGALGLRLAGPRSYGGVALAEAAWMGGGRAEATPDDIERALVLYRLACGLQVAAVGVLALTARG